MRLPIDATTITFIVAGAAESVLDFSIEEPMGLLGSQRGLIVSSRSQLGLPA